MGPGQKAWGHDEMNDVPHFDREGHHRTQEKQSRRWQQRKVTEDRQIPEELPTSTLANFLFISAILSVGILVPGFVYEKMTRNGKSER